MLHKHGHMSFMEKDLKRYFLIFLKSWVLFITCEICALEPRHFTSLSLSDHMIVILYVIIHTQLNFMFYAEKNLYNKLLPSVLWHSALLKFTSHDGF